MNTSLKIIPNQAGVVALVTSIIVGLLLVVITTSAVALMSKELRQAADFDQSVKAYFAAESGVEDAIAEIRRGLATGQSINSLVAGQDSCAPYSVPDADLSGDDVVGYTCQIVSTQTNEATGQLQAEEVAQLDLTGIASFNRLVISWNQSGSSDPQNINYNTTPALFPPGNNWNGIYPAVMETAIIDYPKQTPFDEDDIHNNTVVLKPSAVGTFNPTVNFTSPAIPQAVRCQNAAQGQYNCQATFQAFSDNAHYVLRLHTRYSQANYRIQAFQGITPVEIPNTQVVVDVTGKAGDVFRRVLVKLPLTDRPQANFAILADDNICKVFSVLGGGPIETASSQRGCEGL